MLRRLRRPGRSSVAVVLTLVVAGLTGVGAAGAVPRDRAKPVADTPYAGFRTPGSAVSGGHLGSRRVGASVVYRVDPARRRVAKAFGVAAPVPLLSSTGKRRATLNDTQRAAWIVSKYGSRNNDVQAAAVELALDDLLVGGPYALAGRTTRARLSGLSKRTKIVTFATKMLKGSRLRAGDYLVTLQVPSSVDPGAAVTARVQVLATASGLPVASLATTFALPGQPDQQIDTDADGVALASFAASTSGQRTLSARVGQLPENKLVVLSPTDARASRVVVAQVKSERTLTSPVTVRAAPTVTVTTTRTDVPSPAPVPASFAVAGAAAGSGARPATATLFGPNPTAASCGGPVVRSVSVNTTGSPTTVPAGPAVAAEGWYAWRVEVAGDGANTTATGCGASTFVRAATFTAGPSADATYNTTVRVAGLAPGYTGTGLMRYHSAPPSGQAACSLPQTAQREFTLAANSAGAFTFSFTRPAAVYALRFDLPGAGIDRCVVISTG